MPVFTGKQKNGSIYQFLDQFGHFIIILYFKCQALVYSLLDDSYETYASYEYIFLA